MACVYFSTASPNCPFLNNILPSFLSLASEGGRAPHGASRLQLSPAVPLCAGPEPWGSSLLLPAERVPFTAVLFPWTSFELAVLFPWLLLFPGVPGWECGPPPSPWPGAFFCEFPMASLSLYHSTASSRPHTVIHSLALFLFPAQTVRLSHKRKDTPPAGHTVTSRGGRGCGAAAEWGRFSVKPAARGVQKALLDFICVKNQLQSPSADTAQDLCALEVYCSCYGFWTTLWCHFCAVKIKLMHYQTKILNNSNFQCSGKKFCTGTSKKIEYHEKVNIFCHSFEKGKPIYYIDFLHIEWNISSIYFLTFWWLWLTDNENPKFSVSDNQNIT